VGRGHRSGAKGRKKFFFGRAPSLFGFISTIIGLVVLVSAFVIVSTVWSVSCLLFFNSRCPPCPAICKSGGRASRAPWSRRHCLGPSPVPSFHLLPFVILSLAPFSPLPSNPSPVNGVSRLTYFNRLLDYSYHWLFVPLPRTIRTTCRPFVPCTICNINVVSFFVFFVHENSFAQRFAERRRLLYLTFVKLQKKPYNYSLAI